MAGSPPLSHRTEELLKSLVPNAWRHTVRAVLLEYGTDPSHVEVERIRLDILTLSSGEGDKLRRFMDFAKDDYRDVAVMEYENRNGVYSRRKWAVELHGPDPDNP